MPHSALPSKVLYIDLTRRRFWVEDRGDLFEEYLGGAGVAAQLLKEECPKGTDPFSPDNPIIFAVGPLTCLFPMASKTVAMFKSPLTGELGESHAGGRSAIAIRSAGYGAIVIKGASDMPIYVAVHGSKVYFRDAAAYWGMESALTVGRVIRENEPGSGVRSIMRIGRAGEKLVRYAMVMTETFRHFGRLGLGAVFGSKKLKALVVSGKNTVEVPNKKLFRDVYDELFKLMVESDLLKKYHEIGTPINVLTLNALKGLPTRNLKSGEFEGAEAISGEKLAEDFLGRRVACAHCPVACIHLAALREPYEEEPYFYKTTWVSYDYELTYALGSMLGISDTVGFLKLVDTVEKYGLDAMSTGVCLAWATEAYERKLISKEDLNGLEPKWGDHETYIKMTKLIVTQPNDFYKSLAMGVEAAATKYGGLDFALSFGGNEMPGYHTGPAAHVGYLTGARHSHLDSAGYSLDEKTIGATPSPEKIADELFKEEAWRQVLSSLVVCFFARRVYTPENTSKALRAAGVERSVEELTSLGTKILAEKYEFKFREGFNPENLRVPKRIFETPTPHGKISEETVRKAVQLYVEKVKSVKK
ncbi:MAG: aldehyde ferredoxin oxidoreductase family protein [Candidatus Jordarchaeales archaeon]